MLKSQLRLEFKSKRKLLSKNDKTEMSRSIAANVIDNFSLKGKTVNIFLPIERLNEIDTFLLIKKLQENNVTVCVPVADFENHTLKHVIYNSSTVLQKNDWGIPEPINGEEVDSKEIDIVFVPMLAVDNKGFRVGYGKGFYDRFLASCSKKSVFIGLNYFEPIDEISDVHKDDIPVHYIVTPTNSKCIE